VQASEYGVRQQISGARAFLTPFDLNKSTVKG
jgi:hypothetical protein